MAIHLVLYIAYVIYMFESILKILFLGCASLYVNVHDDILCFSLDTFKTLFLTRILLKPFEISWLYINHDIKP